MKLFPVIMLNEMYHSCLQWIISQGLIKKRTTKKANARSSQFSFFDIQRGTKNLSERVKWGRLSFYFYSYNSLPSESQLETYPVHFSYKDFVSITFDRPLRVNSTM